MIMTLLHVLAGVIVMIVAPAAMLVRKGGRWHRVWGNTFAASMALVLLSAGFMWERLGHWFLFALSIVSAYFIFSAYRIVRRRRRRVRDGLDDGIDLLAAVFVSLAGVWLFVIAVRAGDPLMRSLAPVMGALAVLAIGIAGNDVRGVVTEPSLNGSRVAHLTGMIAAYISAVTAFVVINAHDVPMLLRWLVPSALGSALISGFSIRYRMPIFRAVYARVTRAWAAARRAIGTRYGEHET